MLGFNQTDSLHYLQLARKLLILSFMEICFQYITENIIQPREALGTRCYQGSTCRP